jgi:hypothetical protein
MILSHPHRLVNAPYRSSCGEIRGNGTVSGTSSAEADVTPLEQRVYLRASAFIRGSMAVAGSRCRGGRVIALGGGME